MRCFKLITVFIVLLSLLLPNTLIVGADEETDEIEYEMDYEYEEEPKVETGSEYDIDTGESLVISKPVAVSFDETPVFKKLAAFGIIDNNDLLYEDYITRGDFISYALRAGGMLYDLTEIGANPFSDVEPGSYYYSDILMAYRAGIISGQAGARIAPDEFISVNEAAKILTNILGYKEISESGGGYPGGYMATANSLKIFSGCDLKSPAGITPEDFTQMLFNTLNAPVLRIDGIKTDASQTVINRYAKDEETLLNFAHNIYKVRGVLESNEYTSLFGSSLVGEGRVLIDGMPLFDDTAAAWRLLGHYVEAYYKSDKKQEENTLVYIEGDESRNQVTLVESDDICKDLVSVDNFSYIGEGDKTNTNLKLSNIVVLIHNGKQTPITKELLCPNLGDVTLIDNDNDGLIDVVSVLNYRSILVSQVSPTEYLVSDALGGQNIELNPFDRNYKVIITQYGKTASYENINENDVISYAESISGGRALKQLVLSSKTISGVIDEKSGSENAVVIGGTKYKVSAALFEKININEEGMFYLDHAGRIVAKKSQPDAVYGYLNNLTLKPFGRVKAQIFTENNRWVELEFCDKVSYNGNERLQAVDAYNRLFHTQDNTVRLPERYRQLVLYNVNEEGKIAQIRCAQEFTLWSDEENAAIEQNVFRISAKTTTARYRSGLQSFDNLICLSEETVLFFVPDQTLSDAQQSDFHIAGIGSLIADRYYNGITAYDSNRAAQAKACVMVGDNTPIATTTKLMIVTKNITALKDDGEIGYGIYGMFGGSLISIVANTEETLVNAGSPKEGDIIQFSLNPKGYIQNIDLLYSAEIDKDRKFIINSLYSVITKLCGVIKHVDFENEILVMDYGAIGHFGMKAAAFSVYVYDESKNSVTQGSKSDLTVGSRIFASVRNYQLTEIVVFK
ncbi:MAG: S-layer homology domain-containing protein [Firmicutes bacterium]|nr:S-layer homology domain-containing protein [Bacillota bacterium]